MTPTARWRLLALLGVGATLAAVAIAPRSAVSLQLTYYFLLFVLIIPVHELGHAIAGAFVGFRITSISVGAGPPLIHFRWLGVAVQINLLPLGGLTAAMPRRPFPSMRLRQWILTAGGPAANVVIYVALRHFFGGMLDDSEHHPLLSSARSVNWTVLFMNLVPFRTSEGTASDGYGLFTIPFWSPAQMEEALVRAYGMRVQEALNRDDVAAARQLAEEARARYPASAIPYTYLGTVLHRERRHDEALVAWREGLARTTDPNPKAKALLKNNIAFAEIVRGRAEDLLEADTLSSEAYAVLSELPAVCGTRGAVLLRLGRAAEALPLLVAGEAAAISARNKAYSSALTASALAAVGRHAQARRKLDEARQADPTCELLARAEADIAAGPLASDPPMPAVTDAAGSAAADPGVHALLLRRWRRDMRILAFVAVLVGAERLGFDLVLTVTAIVMSLAPELSGAYALTGFGFSAAFLHAIGMAGSPRFSAVVVGRGEAVLIALALGGAAAWLVARHRRIGPSPRARTPAVLGWIMFSMLLLQLLPDLLSLSWDHSTLAIHESARTLLGLVPALIGFAALLASRARRDVRPLAVVPVLIALLAVVPGSTWYLNHVALAEVPEEGAGFVIAAPVPAKVTKRARITARGDEPVLSPGGRAFVLQDFEAHVTPGDKRKSRFVLHVGDFDGRVVDVDGTAGAFLDDERLIVLRPHADHKGADVLEVRPFQTPEPVWTKPIARANANRLAVHIDRVARTVFVVPTETAEDDAPLGWWTTAEPDTKVETAPLRQRANDGFIAAVPRAGDGGAVLVSRRGRGSGELIWRTAAGDRTLVAPTRRLDCVDPPPGAAQLWCLTARVPILLRIDVEGPRVTRVPGEIAGWSPKMLGTSTLAILRGSEITMLDLDARRGARLEAGDDARRRTATLVDGGLATFERSNGVATLTVYELPAGF